MKHYVWSAINRFGVQAIGFIGNILIARQLTPDDYGLVAMLAIFMGISWNFTEAGFSDCLIRKQDADKKDYATIFMHNITFSLILYTVLFFS
ncbi:MAG: oligosaccharide flippase family protein, partial [Xanthomarina sp.]